ncbi:MAG: cytochrome b5-like heme/steroid binding domain-containing protein [bacterium]
MKKLTGVSLFIFFCVVTAILTAGLVFYQNNNLKAGGNTRSASTATSIKPTSGKTVVLNAAEVAKHSTASDCWMIINAKVYDLSNYDINHPGGTYTIDSYCGKDATVAFDTKGRPGGRPHSSYANSLLDQYYVGDLK